MDRTPPTTGSCRLLLFSAWLAVFLGASNQSAEANVVFNPVTKHWYEAVYVPEGITWNESNSRATNAGGYLCTVTNSAENSFVASLVDISFYSGVSINHDILGPWLGGYRHAFESQWKWVTGESFAYYNWYSNQPDGYGGSEQRLQFYHSATVGETWGDHPGDPISGYSLPRGYIVEYESLPILNAAKTNNVVTISWVGGLQGWLLESSADVASPNSWSLVSTNLYRKDGPLYSLKVTNTTGAVFFRLKSNQ